MIDSVAFFAYPVSDMKRARRFYEETMGLHVGHDFNGQWIEYDIAGQTLAITTLVPDGQPGAKGAFIGLEVDNFDAEIKRLKGLGVKFETDTFETPVCRMAVIQDPDGNGLVIHKRHA